MRSSDPTLRLCALLCVLALSITACGGSLQRRDASAPTPDEGPTEVGGGLAGVGGEEEGEQPSEADGGRAPASQPQAESHSFVLTMVDQNGKNPPDIPVEIDGEITTTLTSNAEGKVVVEGPPGYYTYKVPVRCTDKVQTLSGQTGRFGMAAGQTGTGEVAVKWQHRFGPSGPAFSSKGPYWPPGEEIRIRYDVVDRCEEGLREPNGSLATYAFEPSPTIQIVGSPNMTADSDGYAWVTIRCTSEGEAKVVIHDTLNPSDRLDLARQDQSYGAYPSCRDPAG